jgi:PAS domain-containing protein
MADRRDEKRPRTVRAPEDEAAAAAEFEGGYQGAVVFDPSCRIVYVTPATEGFFGWRNEDVVGVPCESIFDCRNAVADSLCANCGLRKSLERGREVPGMLARVRDATGQRHDVNSTFLYLDPSRYAGQARVIGVFRALGSLPHQLPCGPLP